jgi:hypothetical protein
MIANSVDKPVCQFGGCVWDRLGAGYRAIAGGPFWRETMFLHRKLRPGLVDWQDCRFYQFVDIKRKPLLRLLEDGHVPRQSKSLIPEGASVGPPRIESRTGPCRPRKRPSSDARNGKNDSCCLAAVELGPKLPKVPALWPSVTRFSSFMSDHPSLLADRNRHSTVLVRSANQDIISHRKKQNIRLLGRLTLGCESSRGLQRKSARLPLFGAVCFRRVNIHRITLYEIVVLAVVGTASLGTLRSTSSLRSLTVVAGATHRNVHGCTEHVCVHGASRITRSRRQPDYLPVPHSQEASDQSRRELAFRLFCVTGCDSSCLNAIGKELSVVTHKEGSCLNRDLSPEGDNVHETA